MGLTLNFDEETEDMLKGISEDKGIATKSKTLKYLIHNYWEVKHLETKCRKTENEMNRLLAVNKLLTDVHFVSKIANLVTQQILGNTSFRELAATVDQLKRVSGYLEEYSQMSKPNHHSHVVLTRMASGDE